MPTPPVFPENEAVPLARRTEPEPPLALPAAVEMVAVPLAAFALAPL
jgi:hypothetical protein